MRILFRVDCDRSTGTGHLMRCREIAHFFQEAGDEVAFLINDSSWGEQRLEQYAYAKISFSNMNEELNATKQYFEKHSYDVIFVDFVDKYENSELMTIYSNHADNLVVLSDEYKRIDIVSDVLIATHPKQIEYHYPEQRALLGEQFFIVSQVFIDNQIECKEKIHNVLVSFGGHDPQNVTCKIAQYLKDLSEDYDLSSMRIHFLLGGLYRYESLLREILGSAQFEWGIYKQLESVAPLFMEMDLAISACGNTIYELGNLHIPSMGIGLNDRQDEGGRILGKKNLIRYLGFYSELSEERFKDVLIDLIENFKERMAINDNCNRHFQQNALKILNLILRRDEYEIKRKRS